MSRYRLPPLSSAQLHVLKKIAAGVPAHDGLIGRSQHGGLTGTIHSLVRRGLLAKDGETLTDEGRKAIGVTGESIPPLELEDDFTEGEKSNMKRGAT